MTKRFEYLRPRTVAEALEMKSKHAERAIYWAGGTDLMLLWQRGEVKPDYCIDLTFLPELDYIESEERAVRIGAMASLDDLDRAAGLNQLMDVLGYTARLMCTAQTRTIATVGGNMCNASPAADLSPLFVALDSQVKIVGIEGERSIPMEDFFLGVNKTALSNEELLAEITVPVPASRREACYTRVARTVVDIALVSSAVSVTADDGIISDARVALGSVGPTPIRSNAAEKVLAGASVFGPDKGLLEEAGRLAANDAKAISDMRAGKEYREQMCSVLTQRALDESVRKLAAGGVS